MSSGFIPCFLRFSKSLRYSTYRFNLSTVSGLCPLNSVGFTLSVMWLARSTNFKVLIVSSIFLAEGDKFPKIKVKVLPVRDYWRSRVNFDYLNAPAAFLSPLDSAKITFPKVVKERLIFFNSFNCSSPIAYFLLIFSDPAKSHKLSLPLRKVPSWFWVSISNWKMVCERELLAFMEVCLMVLFLTPFLSSYIQSSNLVTPNSVSPSTKIPSTFDSWIPKGFGFSLS